MVLGELDQLVKEFVEDERLKEGAIVLVRILLERYEVQFKKQLTVAIEL